jgi:hypothetical protein
MCFICGLENPFGLHLRFHDNGQDEVTSAFTIEPNHQGYPGVALAGFDEGEVRVEITVGVLRACQGGNDALDQRLQFGGHVLPQGQRSRFEPFVNIGVLKNVTGESPGALTAR